MGNMDTIDAVVLCLCLLGIPAAWINIHLNSPAHEKSWPGMLFWSLAAVVQIVAVVRILGG